jgi:hypothetical protein
MRSRSIMTAMFLALPACGPLGVDRGADPAAAKADGEDFYSGKSILITVGFSAGGAHFKYLNLISDHMGEHIPGVPSFVVETRQNDEANNWSSYESATEFVDTVADGLELGNFLPELALQQAFAPELYPVFDMGALKWIGAVNSFGAPTCYIRADAGFGTTWDEIKAADPGPHMGWITKGSTGYDMTVFLNELGANLTIFDDAEPDTGQNGMVARVKSGALDGVCWPTGSMKRQLEAEIATGVVVPFMTVKEVTDYPGLPTLEDEALGSPIQRLIKVWTPSYQMLITLAAPPDTDMDKVHILRQAFVDTLADPDFAAAATEMKMPFKTVTGDEVEDAIAAMLDLDPNEKRLAREILGD